MDNNKSTSTSAKVGLRLEKRTGGGSCRSNNLHKYNRKFKVFV